MELIKRNLIVAFAFFTACSLFAFSCRKEDKSCREAICTQEFKTLFVEVENLLPGAPTLTVKAYDVDNAKYRPVTKVNNAGKDVYNYLNDGNFDWLGKIDAKEIYKIEVYNNNILIKTTEIEVGRDCCHVFAAQEQIKITVQ
jgi:hypothetical protein